MNLIFFELSLRGWSVTTNAKATATGSVEVFASCGNKTRAFHVRTQVGPDVILMNAAFDELGAQLWKLCEGEHAIPASATAEARLPVC